MRHLTKHICLRTCCDRIFNFSEEHSDNKNRINIVCPCHNAMFISYVYLCISIFKNLFRKFNLRFRSFKFIKHEFKYQVPTKFLNLLQSQIKDVKSKYQNNPVPTSVFKGFWVSLSSVKQYPPTKSSFLH